MRLFNRIPVVCDVCKRPIKNDIDDYGYFGSHICRQCHFTLLEEETDESWYGLAPHAHTWGDNGRIVIGGTIYRDLDNYPHDGNGYWIESQKAWFIPDDETDGMMGMWSYKQQPPAPDGE